MMSVGQKHTLAVALTTSFITTFMGSALNLAIPNIEGEFDSGAAAMGWIIVAYILSVSAFGVPFGRIADIYGRRKLLILGIGIFCISSLTASFSVNVEMLIIFRIMQGISASMIFSTNNAILIAAFPAGEMGSVLGKNLASTYFGLSIGPVLGGILNESFGWRSIFLVTAFIAFLGFLNAIFGLPKLDEELEDAKFDKGGSGIFVGMIACILYGLTNLTISKSSYVILGLGILLFVFFVVTEKKKVSPVVKIRMFTKDPVFALSNVAAFFNYGATYAVGYLMSIYLQRIQGYGSRMAGIILIAQPVFQAILSPFMGRLSDRISPGKLASAGMGICAFGLGMLMKLGEGTSVTLVILSQVVMGIGFAVFSSPNTNAIMSRVDYEDLGVANSIVATMRNLGQSSSMAVLTIIIGMHLGNIPLENAGTSELLATIKTSFLIFVVLCIAGMLMSLKSGSEKIKD